MSDAQTIVQAWLDRCRREPSRTALRHKRRGVWRSVSWRDYHENVARMAVAIQRLGLRHGAVVSIVSESRPEWLYADMASQALGCVSHGVYPTCSASLIGLQLEVAGSDLVFVENAEQAQKILGVDRPLPALRRIVVFDTRGLRELKSERVLSLADFMGDQPIVPADMRRFEQQAGEVQKDDVAFVCATAGSTGAPRLAAITHASAMRRARTMQAAFDARADDGILCFVPLANAAERMFSAVLPLLTPMQVHFAESASTVANDLREVQPDWVHAPARFWEKLLARTESTAVVASPMARRLYRRSTDPACTDWMSGLSRRRLLHAMGLARARAGYSGGAAASASLSHWFRVLGLTLQDVYESAETCGPALRLPLALSGGDAELGTDVKIGANDELLIRSDALFSGYWSRKTVQAPQLTPGDWFATADAVQTEGDRIRVAGPMAHWISTHDGRQVSPAVVERELHADPYIAHAVVTGVSAGQCMCLLGLEMESVLSFAQTQAIPFVDFSHLVRNDAIRSLLHRQIEGVNQRLGDGLRIVHFRVLPESPHSGDEEVTPNLRAQREFLLKRFAVEMRELEEPTAV